MNLWFALPALLLAYVVFWLILVPQINRHSLLCLAAGCVTIVVAYPGLAFVTKRLRKR
jgi:hypothetical protein